MAGRFGQRADPQCPQGSFAALVAGVGVNLVRCLAERGPRRAERQIDRPQMRERMRADVTLGRGGQQCPRHPSGPRRTSRLPPRRRRG